MRILVVDDEKLLVKGMKFNLENEGYQVECAYDGAAAVELARNGRFDLIILDVMMPEVDGLEACMRIREFSNVPIIMLTAKGEDADKLMGFECGADDYLTKPFNTGELMARLRAMTRRSLENKNEVLTCGNVTLNRETLEIKTDSASFRLAGREFRMFEFLISRMGTPVSEQQFVDKIFDDDTSEAEDGVVFLYISYLRTKLNAIGADVTISTTDDNRYVLNTK